MNVWHFHYTCVIKINENLENGFFLIEGFYTIKSVGLICLSYIYVCICFTQLVENNLYFTIEFVLISDIS